MMTKLPRYVGALIVGCLLGGAVNVAIAVAGSAIEGGGGSSLATPVSVANGGSAQSTDGWLPYILAPTSPNAANEEFSTIGNMTVGATMSVTAIDPYAAFTTDGRYGVGGANPFRTGWLCFQGDADAGLVIGAHKAYTLPTNVFVIARVAVKRRGAPANTEANDNFFGMGFSTTGAGVPDFGSFLTFSLDSEAGSVRTYMDGGGADPQYTLDAFPVNVAYMAIHKVGTTFHSYVGGSDGELEWVGSNTQSGAGTMDRFLFRIGNSSSAAPGNLTACVDYLRFYETATTEPR